MHKKILIIISAFLFVAIHCQAQCTATITSGNSATFCQGGSDTLISTSAYSYQWYKNGIAIGGATNSIYVATSAGMYTVVDSILGTCTVTSNAIAIVVNSLPTATISPAGTVAICAGSSVTLNGNTGTGLTYQWRINGYIIAGATYSIYIAYSAAIYTLAVTNTNGCMSMSTPDTVVVNPLPATPVLSSNSPACIGDTLFLYYTNPPAGAFYSWAGPNSFSSPAQNPYMAGALAISSGTYILTVNLSGCTATSSTTVLVASCDSVWPGDVNSDHVVNNQDALDLALGYGSTGTSRSGASISWVAQYSANWGTNIVAGVDKKHADCDGNGTIDANDTTAINANYGLTHPRGQHQATAKIAGLPDLYFDLSGIPLIPGSTISVPIKLGSPSLPLNNILGLAAEVKISGITPATNPAISYPVSWLGNSSNTFSFRKVINANRIDWAYARKDHQNISGSATIANLTFTLPLTTSSFNMVLYFDNVKIIDNAGNVLTGYNVVDDTAVVQVDCCAYPYAGKFFLTPNPSGAQCDLQMLLGQGKPGDLKISITDMLGKVVWTYMEENVQGYKVVSLPAPTITSGIYMIHIQAEGFPPQLLKWVRN